MKHAPAAAASVRGGKLAALWGRKGHKGGPGQQIKGAHVLELISLQCSRRGKEREAGSTAGGSRRGLGSAIRQFSRTSFSTGALAPLLNGWGPGPVQDGCTTLSAALHGHSKIRIIRDKRQSHVEHLYILLQKCSYNVSTSGNKKAAKNIKSWNTPHLEVFGVIIMYI